jgi:hypothetical protein
MFNKNLATIIEAEPSLPKRVTKEQFGHYSGGRKSYTTKEYEKRRKEILEKPLTKNYK